MPRTLRSPARMSLSSSGVEGPDESYDDQTIAAIYAGRAIGSAREESQGLRRAQRCDGQDSPLSGDVDTLLCQVLQQLARVRNRASRGMASSESVASQGQAAVPASAC